MPEESEDERLQRLIDNHPAVKALSQSTPAAPTPQMTLQGGVQFTPEMNATANSAAALTFPQSGDSPIMAGAKNLALPINQMGRGLAQVPEDLLNFAAGAAQQGMGVPQGQRKTVGDVARMVNPGIVTPSEILQSAAYRDAMAKNPYASMMVPAAGFVGGLAAPIGAMEAAATKIPLSIKAAAGAVPAMAKIGELGKEVPVVKRLAETWNDLQKGAQYSGLQKFMRNPVTGGVGAGAGYGAAFAAGNSFGQNRQLPEAQELAGPAGVGGALGGGFSLLGHAISSALAKKKLQPHSDTSPRETLKAKEAPIEPAPEPHVLENDLASQVSKVLNDVQTDFTHKANQVGQILDGAASKFSGEGIDHARAILNVRRAANSHLAREKAMEQRNANSQATRQDNRQYQGEVRQEGREHQAGVREQNRQYSEQKAQQSEQNRQGREQDRRQYQEDVHDYRRAEKLQDRSHTEARQDARTQQQNRRHDDIRQETRSHQEQRDSHSRERMAQHTEEGNADYNDLHDMITHATSENELGDYRKMIYSSAPGVEGPAKLTSAQRSDLIDHLREQQDLKFPRQADKPPGKPEGPETPPSGPNKILGMFRKVRNGQGKREDRPKFFLSVEAFAKETGMSPEEELAVRDYVDKGAVIRREQTYHELELDHLLKWAFEPKNLDNWIGEQHSGGVSARQRFDEDGSHSIQMQEKIDQGKVQNITLQAAIRKKIELETGEQLSLTQRKSDGEIKLVPEGKPRVRFTTCGITKDYAPAADGVFNGKTEPLELGEFTPPRTVDEMYDRVIHLKGLIDDAAKDLAEHKKRFEGTAEQAITDAFERTKLPWINGEAPNTGMHYVDKYGVTTTAEFQQAPTKANYESSPKEVDPDYKYMADAIENATSEDKVDYKVLKRDKRFNSALHVYFPGIPDLGTAVTMFGPEIRAVAKGIGEFLHIDTLTAGTCVDIFEDNPSLGGQKVADEYYRNAQEIWFNFFHDKEGEFSEIKSAEDMARLVQKFKNASEKTRSGYRFQARKLAKEQAAKEDRVYTQGDEDEALKEADTATMIVQKWAELAHTLQGHIDEMAIRRKDAETGEASKEGRKFYLPSDYDAEGRVKSSIYNKTYDQALRKMHDKLVLRPSEDLHAWGMVIPNYATALFRNNIRTSIKNFFDQAPISVAHFHFHLAGAIKDYMFNPELRTAINRTPVHPANSMQNLEMQQALKDPRKMSSMSNVEKATHVLNKVNHFLGTTLDPVFKGGSPLLSQADVAYARLGAIASLRKSAWHRGIPWEEFVDQLLSGDLSQQTEKALERGAKEGAQEVTRTLQDSAGMELAKDNVQTTNTMGAGINVNLMAESPLGRATQMTATPGARAAKYVGNLTKNARADTVDFVKKAMEGDWHGAMRTGGAGAKLAIASLLYAGMAGRGAIDPAIQATYKGIAAATGNNELAERHLQELDHLNILRDLTGIDYSNTGFGPSYLTNFSPVSDAVDKTTRDLGKAATKNEPLPVKAFDSASIILGEGLHLFPSIGPVGSEFINQSQSKLDAAAMGKKDEYFPSGGVFPDKVTIPNYTMGDAIRGVILGGTEPKAREMIDAKRLAKAKGADAKFGARSRMPSGSAPEKDGAFLRNLIVPRRTQ